MALASPDNAPDLHQLLRDLQDERFWVRERAAEALGHFRSPDAIAGLISALDDATSTVRERAAESLARVGSDQALSGLLNSLGSEETAELLTRAESKEAVAHIHHTRSEVVDTLHRTLRSGGYAQRWQAAQSLWKIEGSQVIEALFQALEEPETDNSFRQDASTRAVSARPDEYALFDALSRQDFQAAWRIAQDLAHMNSDYAFIVFERVLELSA